MKIIVNGNEENIESETPTVKDAVEQVLSVQLNDEGLSESGKKLGIAVAQGEAIIPRSRWASTELHDGDSVEIITAVQGG